MTIDLGKIPDGMFLNMVPYESKNMFIYKKTVAAFIMPLRGSGIMQRGDKEIHAGENSGVQIRLARRKLGF